MKISKSFWADAPIPVIIIDKNDRIKMLNPACELLLNRSLRNIKKQRIHDFITLPENTKIAFETIRKDHRATFIKDINILPWLAPSLSANAHISILKKQNGALAIFLEGCKSDFFTNHPQRQESAYLTLSNISRVLAHEIKNPLTGISSAAQLLESSAKADDKALTALIIEETRRIAKLLDRMEDFESQSVSPEEEINLHALLDKAQKLSAIGFAKHMIFETDYDPSLPALLTDPDCLMQVFLNLMKNASQSCASGSILRVKTAFNQYMRVQKGDGQSAKHYLEIEISDNGPGIPDNISKYIYDPFISGREDGTGLGLPITSKIITDLGGFLANRRENGWTIFNITLPIK